MPSPVSDRDYFNGGVVSNRYKVELGRLLFFDKILSGNRNISCATCHHPSTGTGDDLSLPAGEGSNGLGLQRNLGLGKNAIPERVPRHSPSIFNLGAKEFTTLFHDGRVQKVGSRITSPVGSQMPPGLDNQLAVQAMLPVTSADEMAGQSHENAVAKAAHANRFAGSGGVWELLARRLRANSKYVSYFRAAFPGKIRSANDITFVDAANAIAAFEAIAFRSDQSPFDHYLRGDRFALSHEALVGMNLFYGRAKCSTCHSGKFQTDHKFHAIAMPQIGPGKGDKGYRDMEDYGRELVTRRRSDRYKFRTPSLRNVTVTGPYGHAGAYSSLESVVRHHLDPVRMLHRYDPPSNVTMRRRSDFDSTDFSVHRHSSTRSAIAKANDLSPVSLTDLEVHALVAFLNALTDPRATNLEGEIPESVPSGLPVSDFVMFPDP